MNDILIPECLAKNDHFAAKVAYIDDYRVFVIIYRLDTFEFYTSFNISNTDKKSWILEASKVISELDVPIDWKRPHRYCLARYARQVLNDDSFFGELSWKLSCNILSNEDINRYMLISRLKETVLIKKLNQLSIDEKIQLFILKDWEIEGSIGEGVTYAIYGRKHIYERLYDKEKYETYYKKYWEKVESVFGKLDEDE
ncbi:hypothetical protein BGI40_08730 [Snodgrassella communis]|jgi:hypothetical protein|uniref:Uncharacterized protein n=1 Tax=Snodgrassella communis TaxID=2946699 RepID=A0A836MPB1_9NEIS|nr:hypothetical protein [Snodgrassella communis]KDN13798.1 hypothetical protein SALWKB29_2170 [Snodgrassella communis]PIT09505.1 hypothetical protein BGI29_04210 [Snodgrassella communis]PIT26069.1 hypothetical protein BGI39_10630 [Snodgrassella communis]PIT28568.1 hypothetical protein BGI38_04965 [Snodgrassella communis]PIT32359.1 hypothetical protein BGI40_08730 [Snodgrassella communis]